MSITVDSARTIEMIHPSEVPEEPTIERRSRSRLPMVAQLRFFGMGSTSGFTCKATDISESGLRISASPGAPLAVGQRFQVVADETCENVDVAAALTGGCYATVVRTSAAADAHAGLRFDRPLLF